MAARRSLDSTRLITSAIHGVKIENGIAMINDPLGGSLDVLAVNQYFGWYTAWPVNPSDLQWKSVFNKPLIMSGVWRRGVIWKSWTGRHSKFME